MSRNVFTAAAVIAAAFSATSLVACSSDTPAFNGKGDGAAGASGNSGATGGSSGGDGASATGGATSDGAAGASATGGSSGGGQCGNVFGHTGACTSCLDSHCCDFGTACGGVPDCVKLADCTRGCDSKTGTMGDQCRTDCNSQFLTTSSRSVYNSLVQCMGQFCLSECPFHGP